MKKIAKITFLSLELENYKLHSFYKTNSAALLHHVLQTFIIKNTVFSLNDFFQAFIEEAKRELLKLNKEVKITITFFEFVKFVYPHLLTLLKNVNFYEDALNFNFQNFWLLKIVFEAMQFLKAPLRA